MRIVVLVTYSAPEEVLVQVAEAVELRQRGHRDQARTQLQLIWDAIGERGDALHRCAVAHAMADTQDDPRRELLWDLRALNAATEVSDARAAQAGMPPAASMLPSLHLNLGDVYLRLGDVTSARRHAEAGLAAPDQSSGGYGAMVRRGLEALRARVDA